MRAPLLMLLAVAACGPGRDTTFHRIKEISAVTKLEVAEGWIYFVEGGALKRVAKTGGDIEVITQTGVVDFAATKGHLYAATVANGVLSSDIPLTGVVGAGVSISSDVALAIAADQNGVSWVTCSTVTHAALDGTAQTSAAVPGTCLNSSTRLALDSSTAYGVNGSGEWYASRSGGPTKTFGSLPCQRIAAGGGWVYCADTTNGLKRIDPLNRTVEDVFAGQVRTFAIGELRLYAAVGEDLVSSPRNSTRTDVLGTYSKISAIALDSAAVYFVNTEGDRGLLLSTAP